MKVNRIPIYQNQGNLWMGYSQALEAILNRGTAGYRTLQKTLPQTGR
ncbi:hypothetical protein MPNT_130028 [Candidatus Methylacidithermus pantelleriae]|uniref:Uncharacterized protein n=1 Tax=Candidatus Methylacidithermus pantelleriae TaxID=2744239 RepID=A0A8J2BJL1_9BACT|nr:hypothetical protein MPNT_130028 [Candidatus Methylacidithermus pantelleriae]